MSPFWRGFLSIFTFGKQPCWLFGHYWQRDFLKREFRGPFEWWRCRECGASSKEPLPPYPS